MSELNANPETEGQEEIALAYIAKHGETELSKDDLARCRMDVPLDPQGQK